MGTLYKGVCYPTVEASKQAACGDAAAFSLQGTDVIASGCMTTDFTGPTFDVAVVTNGSLSAVHTFYYGAPIECDFSGGMELATGWGYAALAVLLTMYCGRALIDLFNVNNNPG